MGLHIIIRSHSNFEFPFCSSLIFLFSTLFQAQLMSKFKPRDGLGMSLEYDDIYNSPTWMIDKCSFDMDAFHSSI
jgi:hypothetical protein